MWASLVAVTALLAQNAAAQNMLRFACSQLVVERTDPIVNPGQLYTPHLHQIVGGNSFNLTMDPAGHDLPTLSTCTSCTFKQDKSNYWTAVLFFKAKNGTYKRVPQTGNGGPQGQLVNKGGLDVYYIPSGKTTAFKAGFRMIAGNAANTDVKKVTGSAICHRAWGSSDDNKFTGGAPCTGADTVELPNKPVPLIRQTLIFPGCWDGKNLDSPNHRDHVAYGAGSGATGGGGCPSTHPVKLPQIMYEIMWNTTNFMDKSMWPSDGTNPFIYSMNIGGAAAHGDYVFGWEGQSLQKAMDSGCTLNKDCPKAGLTAQTPDQYNACVKKQQAPEEVDGWLKAMPMGEMAVKA
jgi:hypothetical protein